MKTTLISHPSATLVVALAAALMSCGPTSQAQTQPDPNWFAHDRERPLPEVVDPGTSSTPDQAGRPPSDATVLFDGRDISPWVSMNGSPTKWIVRNGYMECVQGSGYIRTLQNFGDCQLHIEWATPAKVEGEGQGRGNSGVFFGLGRYEIQVLDSHGNRTYADGSAGSAYGQYPPLVNASRPSGEWQSYDIIYTAPRFDEQGEVVSPVRLTVFHNGVLIQNDVALTGPTAWLGRPVYTPHPEKTPIALQDHGNPVRYRNIWVRELGPVRKPEFTLATDLLDRYTGTYERGQNDNLIVSREGGQLALDFSGVKFMLFAESPTKFFAKTTDVQCEFKQDGNERIMRVSVGEGGFRTKKIK